MPAETRLFLCRSDNFGVLLHDPASGATASIDAPEAAPIEAALKANWSAGAIDSVKVSADGLLSDIHGSADYRANLIKVMAQRAVAG